MAPNAKELHEDNVRLVRDVHRFDGLRTDRTCASHGLEVRLPFADRDFVDYYFSIDPELRKPTNGIEKYLLRKAFDGYVNLPSEVLWRRKDAFSDSVSKKEKSWYQYIQEHIENNIMKIVSVKLEKNDADIYMKNTNKNLFKEHTLKYMDEIDVVFA